MADLILYTGPMFSSKTTKLLMEADKRYYQKQKVIAFKSKADDRYSKVGEIVTHNFNKIPAHLVESGEEIIQTEVEKLMPYCTRIVKCKSVCSVCQKDARYTFKKSGVKHVESFESHPSAEQIQVGGAELYEPRCQEHHNYMRD